jgi:subtilisin-like proprotein convertase family protein
MLLRVLCGVACLGLLKPAWLLAATNFNGTNSTQIVINDYSGVGPPMASTPYPSSISVAGLSGKVSHVTVTVWGLYHTSCADISMLLVDPSGTNGVVLMSGAGGFDDGTGAGLVSVGRLTFDDSASTALYLYTTNAAGEQTGFWSITNGNYQPTDAAQGFNYFTPPAPASPYGTNLSAGSQGFSGVNPNGTWSLYVQDEYHFDDGVITNGWSLSISTGLATGNQPPSVTITNPIAGATFLASATVMIDADARDTDGTVTNVQFFDGSTSLGNVASSPYELSIALAVGSHTLTAVATDNQGATTTSPAVTVSVLANLPPTVTITNPLNGATFSGPATVTIQAVAGDPDGSVTNVQFFDGTVALGNVASSPYQLSAALAIGTHTLTAVATDNFGATTTSSAVTVSVIGADLPPTIAITSPANGSVFSAPATISIQASAADSDGTVSQVQFFNGTNLLGVLTASPYVLTVTNLAAGNYTLVAVAIDNLNSTTTYAVSITVTNPATASVTLRGVTLANGLFTFTFSTQTGYTYAVQSAPALDPSRWVTFTNIQGNGSVAQIIDSGFTNSTRYYRVATH